MTTAVRKGAGAAGILLREFVRAGCYRKKQFCPPPLEMVAGTPSRLGFAEAQPERDSTDGMRCPWWLASAPSQDPASPPPELLLP